MAKRAELMDQVKMLDKNSRWQFVQANLDKLNPVRQEPKPWWWERPAELRPHYNNEGGRHTYSNVGTNCLACWEHRLQKYVEASRE